MNLAEISERIKGLPDLPRDIAFGLFVFLVAVGGYFVGRIESAQADRASSLRVLMRGDVVSGNVAGTVIAAQEPEHATVPKANASKGIYVGSRSGQTFHLPWCSGAKQIKEENQVWFMSKEEAVARGYRPASNCKGL